MSGYCDDCGNTLCVCGDTFEVAAPGERPLLLAVPDHASGPARSLSPEKAAEMARIKALTYREERAKQQAIERSKRVEAAETVNEAVSQAVTSKALDGQSIEDLADKIVYRNARIALLGGELFAPTSLKELTEVAKAWSGIAKSEADRRRQKLPDEAEPTPVQDVAAHLTRLTKVMATRARQRAIDGVMEKQA